MQKAHTSFSAYIMCRARCTGHFAERAWAALLSNPLSPSQIEELKRNSTGTTPAYNIHYVGSLSNIEF